MLTLPCPAYLPYYAWQLKGLGTAFWLEGVFLGVAEVRFVGERIVILVFDGSKPRDR